MHDPRPPRPPWDATTRRFAGSGSKVAAGAPPSPIDPGVPPARVGAYTILEELGSGGMGTVYLAEQQEPVRRQVALKVVRLGMDTAAVLARFELERRALAVMNHDAIARVYEAGTTEAGQPYFVMEYVPGMPLTQYCDRHELSVEERVQLFRKVCAGVQHAHQKGVIHRDLKPGNVLVALQQGEAVPKIIDFGLARATDHVLVQASLSAERQEVMGTPEYMSPEQADPETTDIDTRTDIYSLGVMLYELLAGVLPFTAATLRRAGLGDMQRLIREVVPPRPSTRVSQLGVAASSVSSLRRTTPTALMRALRSDLDWVVLRAIDKDRNRRYDSAAGLSMDLERYLGHQPLQAGPPGAWYRLRKLVRRRRGVVLASAAVFATAVAGAGLALWYAVEASAQRDVARERALQIARQRDEIARQKGQVEAAVRRFDLLSLVVRLRQARDELRTFHPAWPERQDDLRRWLEKYQGLATDGVAGVNRGLQELRRRPRAASAAAGALEDPTEQFLFGALHDLREDLRRFASADLPRARELLRWAGAVGELTVERHREAWERARAAIARADGVVASELYRRHPIDLRPQVGLVPLGVNPATGLWEFYHLRSAWDPLSEVDPRDLPIPAHDPETGHVAVGEDTGIVFVLLPGGIFRMGAQAADPGAPNHDPRAQGSQAPVREVTLAPFFLARHELTQGQWARLCGGDRPSYYAAGGRDFAGGVVTAAHPVERVSWTSCVEGLARHGLVLPTEAQWEYAARAGTDTPWWSGRGRDSLLGAVNLADQAAARAGGQASGIADWPELDDGFVIHAPVDTLRPNPWGLHHVYGNVWEWCRDRDGSYGLEVTDGDGLRRAEDGAMRMGRGGCFSDPAGHATSAYRNRFTPSLRSLTLGLRAARAL